jgi:hypothetical protein
VLLHPWLKEQLRDILKTLPTSLAQLPSLEENRVVWKSWQEGLTVRVTLPEELPPLRMLWWFWTTLLGTKHQSFSCGCSPEGSWCSNHAVRSFLAKHERVDAANPCPAGIGRALPEEPRGDHRMARSGGSRMEPRANAF